MSRRLRHELAALLASGLSATEGTRLFPQHAEGLSPCVPFLFQVVPQLTRPCHTQDCRNLCLATHFPALFLVLDLNLNLSPSYRI